MREKVNSDIGCRTGPSGYIGCMAGRYDNPMPELIISPSQGLWLWRLRYRKRGKDSQIEWEHGKARELSLVAVSDLSDDVWLSTMLFTAVHRSSQLSSLWLCSRYGTPLKASIKMQLILSSSAVRHVHQDRYSSLGPLWLEPFPILFTYAAACFGRYTVDQAAKKILWVMTCLYIT